MAVFFLTLVVFGLFFALMSVRLIFLKNGEFRGTCASQSPFLAKEGITCGYCGKIIGEGDPCGDTSKHAEQVTLPEIKKNR